jgi:hypothetical protein
VATMVGEVWQAQSFLLQSQQQRQCCENVYPLNLHSRCPKEFDCSGCNSSCEPCSCMLVPGVQNCLQIKKTTTTVTKMIKPQPAAAAAASAGARGYSQSCASHDRSAAGLITCQLSINTRSTAMYCSQQF